MTNQRSFFKSGYLTPPPSSACSVTAHGRVLPLNDDKGQDHHVVGKPQLGFPDVVATNIVHRWPTYLITATVGGSGITSYEELAGSGDGNRASTSK